MATFEPYFKNRTQRLYRFPNGYGASVVKIHDDTHELAVIKFRADDKTPKTATQTMADQEQPWFIDYNSPLGLPKSGLAEADVQKYLAEIEALKTPARAEP
jgi:hypothetical protein